MKSSNVANCAAQLGVLVGCLIMVSAEGLFFFCGLLLGVACAFHAAKGMQLGGWFGARSEEQIQARLGDVEAELRQLDSAPESPARRRRLERLNSQREMLWQQLGDCTRAREHSSTGSH